MRSEANRVLVLVWCGVVWGVADRRWCDAEQEQSMRPAAAGGVRAAPEASWVAHRAAP